MGKQTVVLGITATAAALSAAVMLYMRRKRKPADVPEGYEKIALHETEQMAGLILNPAVGTFTFYTGSMEEAEEYFRKRYRDILNANPWMAGRMVYDQGKPCIVTPSAISDDIVSSGEADGSLLQINPGTVNVNACMGIIEQCKHAAKADIPWGYAAIGDKDAPLVRLVLVPCRNADGTPADTSAGGAADFCVLFFTSHLAGDGHTHYKLLSMFSSEQPVETLNATRIMGFNDKSTEVLGYNGMNWMMSSAHILHTLYKCLFGKKAKFFSMFVDHDKIADLKAEAVAASEDVSFVSTNDVLMSCLGKFAGVGDAGVRSAIMPANFRGRMTGVTDSDAGNYEQIMLFDMEIYESPVGIRKALNVMKNNAEGGERQDVACMTQPLPTMSTFRTDRFAMITNWSSFHKDVVVPGCEEILHVPGGDFESILPMLAYEVIVVYRAKPGQLAVVVFSKEFNKDDYIEGMPFKDFEVPK